MTFVNSRPEKVDIAIAALASAIGLFLMYQNAAGDLDAVGTSPGYLVMPLFLAVTAPLAWRRDAPLAAVGVSAVALLVNVVLFSDVVRCGVVFPLFFLLAFSAGARLELREAVGALLLALVGVIPVCLSDPELHGASDLALFVPLTAVIWGIGRLVRSRARLTEDLLVRTNELRNARDQRARLEIASDRARMSAELDELLQRRLGELARLAAAGPVSGDPARTGARLVEIEHESRRTLEEMRELVGALREGVSGPADTSPQPALIGLDALLLRMNGSDAGLSIEGNPRTLPAAVELSAYRIVEHLVDGLDDSAKVAVRVRFTDEALELSVSGPAKRRSAGALERARERVSLHHGKLEISTQDGHARTRVVLPVSAT